MSTQMAAFAFGCLLLLVAVLGGGFELKELKVPKVGRGSRLISCMFGMLFIVLGINPGFAEMLPGRSQAPTPPAAAPPAQPDGTATTARTGGTAMSVQPQAPAPPASKVSVERPSRPRTSSSTRPRTERSSTSPCKAGKGTHWEQRPRIWMRRLKGACQ